MTKSGLTNLRTFVEPSIDCETNHQTKTAVVVRLPARRKNEQAIAQTYASSEADRKKKPEHYRDAVCSLCERVVSMALNVPLADIQSKSRSKADVAMARQIAMYLAHTKFSILLTEVGLHFRRDRTTVSYACAQVEDKRDEFSFDVLICQLEALLGEALEAITHCRLLNECSPVEPEQVNRSDSSLVAHLSFLESGEPQ